MITHFRKISSKSVYKAACSFQPLEIITANSLSRVVSPWQAVITLNPIISALNHVFQGLAKNSISYSRLRRIIRALGFKFHPHSPYRYCHASLLGHCFSNCPRTFSADHIFLHTVTIEELQPFLVHFRSGVFLYELSLAKDLKWSIWKLWTYNRQMSSKESITERDNRNIWIGNLVNL